MRNRTTLRDLGGLAAILVFLLLTVLTGCSRSEHIQTDVPDGWESDGGRWWTTGVDTSATFRRLESMDEMGIPGSHLLNLRLTGTTDVEKELARRKIAQHVKVGLLPLYRNRPEIVDSLFEKYVFPKMADAPIKGDVQPVISRYKRDGYRILSRHFRAPHTLLKLGKDIPVPVPDSLIGTNLQGSVFMQVYIDNEGSPRAIEKLEGIHPVLDAIAMRATTKMRWQPAYVLRGGTAEPISSWARFRVNFSTGG
ncbi:MAG: energy transducer TonB [Rhodothermales bacterium]|nr:energy transducer TonB [Rhodothermales bacterium]